jgi:hypothetical protein
MSASRVLLAACAVLTPFLAASAAPPAPTPPAAASPGAPGVAKAKPVEPDVASVYSYEVGGRRDPFRSLLVRNTSEKDRVRPPGLAGVLVDELELQGTVRIRSGWVAMMRSADNRSYLVRKGMTLFDGEVTDVAAHEVTFRQNVNDPTNPKPFREVVKALTLQRKP